MGYAGVCLNYAREVVFGWDEIKSMGTGVEKSPSSAAATEKAILDWKVGTLKTIEMTGSEDFVAVK